VVLLLSAVTGFAGDLDVLVERCRFDVGTERSGRIVECVFRNLVVVGIEFRRVLRVERVDRRFADVVRDEVVEHGARVVRVAVARNAETTRRAAAAVLQPNGGGPSSE